MSNTFTVDASVFLNAFNPYEEGHQDSQRLLARMQDRALPIIVPTLLLPEIAAAIGRGRDDTALAQQAADVAAQHRLRGSDAVYAAVALRFGSTLITLDREQRDRVSSVITARYPDEALPDLT